jgi:hypothetical protein
MHLVSTLETIDGVPACRQTGNKMDPPSEFGIVRTNTGAKAVLILNNEASHKNSRGLQAINFLNILCG